MFAERYQSTKMSLNAFLGDESFGSTNWADDIDDLPALRKYFVFYNGKFWIELEWGVF